MSLVIRTFTKADIPVIANFQQRLAEETENVTLDRNKLVKGIEAMLSDPNRGTYYLAELDGQVVGCHSITFEWSDWRNGMVWWLQSLYVIESQRKNGVFKKMFEHLQRTINNDPNIVGLRLYVDKTNTRAQQVYQAMGMNGEHYSVFELMK